MLTGRGRLVLAAALRATPLLNGNDVLPHATDQAIMAGVAGVGVREDEDLGAWQRREEIPFESRRGYHAVLGTDAEGRSWTTVKGAPEVVLPLAETWRRDGTTVSLDPSSRHTIDEHVEQLAEKGLRVLAVAQTHTEPSVELGDGNALGDLELLGFVALADLVRPTAAAAVRDLNAAGVRVAMVTGDHPSTAEAIAAELGLSHEGRVLTGADLDQMSDDELHELLDDVTVFARVAPTAQSPHRRGLPTCRLNGRDDGRRSQRCRRDPARRRGHRARRARHRRGARHR